MRGRRRWAFLLAAIVAGACSNPSPVVPATALLSTPSALQSTRAPAVATTGASAGASSATTDGSFHLELVVPRTVWHTAEAISGRAILSYAGEQPTLIAASSQAVIVFVYEEIGGERTVAYPISADCQPYTLDPARPIAEQVRTSAVAEAATLPPGNWTITAVAQFAGGPGAIQSPFNSLDLCSSTQHELRVSLAFTVLD
jgi:hypothetical protein